MMALGIYACFIKSVLSQVPKRCQIVVNGAIIASTYNVSPQSSIHHFYSFFIYYIYTHM